MRLLLLRLAHPSTVSHRLQRSCASFQRRYRCAVKGVSVSAGALHPSQLAAPSYHPDTRWLWRRLRQCCGASGLHSASTGRALNLAEATAAGNQRPQLVEAPVAAATTNWAGHLR